MYILDTNVVSEARKIRAGRGDSAVANWLDEVSPEDMYISVISVHELETGISLKERADKIQGSILREWFENHVLVAFKDRILPVTTEAAIESAKLHVPNPQPLQDAYIAGTALANKMVVVTRNISDFEKMKVPVFNPWDHSSS